MIAKAERAELRGVVRQQFKVLRAEVEQRQAELLADVEAQITEKFSEEDAAWGGAAHLAHEAVLEANRKINDAYRDLLGDAHVERMYVQGQLPAKPTQRRHDLRGEAQRRLEAEVKAALLQLDRQEADLLRTLSVGSLESEEAREFLTKIPVVADLVPAARLAELEAALDDRPEPDEDEPWRRRRMR